ncbi:MAG: hypothetical protein ACFFDH_01645 [Promethearchaeota archaeon]
MMDSKRIKIRLKVISLISIILFTGIYSVVLMFIPNSPHSNMSGMMKEDESDDLINHKNNLRTSGVYSWWNKSYRSRQLINISNHYPYSINNYGVSLVFNYTELNMNQGTLSDIRIIEYDEDENPHLRKYYFEKDYPGNDLVTIWFNTNVTANHNETDTYLYYSYVDAQIDPDYFMNESSNSFGWIRNGGFELDVDTVKRTNHFFGWNFTDDVVPSDVFAGPGGDLTPDAFYQHNQTTSFGLQDRVAEDDYSFKWGDTDNYLQTEILPNAGHNFFGSLFSYPFIVPEVVGGGGISLEYYRNVRVYDSDQQDAIYFFSGIFTGTTYDSDVTSHDILRFGENYQSQGNNQGDETIMRDVYDQSSTYGVDFNTRGGSPVDKTDGEITGGGIEIDLSDKEGQTIFLEFGMYGDEETEMCAFAQVDAIKFNYTNIETSLDLVVEERMSEITIIVKDIDGRIVPNAEVSLINSSLPTIDPEFSGDTNGTVFFEGVQYGIYDIWVNYTILSTNIETNVYNTTEQGYGSINVTDSIHSFTIKVNIWTIDFEIVDFDEDPLNYGYIEVNSTEGAGLIDNLTLDSSGKATFRWIKSPQYYYRVYYENIDYNIKTTALNGSYIFRSNYEKEGEKFQTHSILVNNSNVETPGFSTFTINKTIYTNGSLTEIGNKKIIEAEINVTIPDYNAVNHKLESISIYYIDKNDYYDESYRIYYKDGAELDEFYSFQIDMRTPDLEPITLEEDQYEVYGLKVVATGVNTTQCNGIIDIKLNETTNIYNITDMSKMYIRVVDSEDNGWIGVKVVINSLIDGQDFFVNLTTYDSVDPLLKGYAKGKINNQIPLWYLRGYEYNISLYWSGSYRKLNVTYAYPDQWRGPDDRDYYNYTLTGKSNISLWCNLGGGDPNDYGLILTNLEVENTVTWNENITVQVNFSKTDNGGNSYTPVITDETVTCHIKSTGVNSRIILEKSMISLGNDGIFNVTFNSSKLSAGGAGKLYSIIVSGKKDYWGIGYATNLSDSIFINSIETTLSMHDYFNLSNIISDTSAIFGEFVNLTFSFYNTSRLIGAELTYKWLGLDPIQFYEDPVNDGFYSATINTSLAEVWGTRTFEIVAKLENYTTQTLLITLSITERPTKLNGETDLVYMNSKVWVEDPNPFTFSFQDSITEEDLCNLTTSTYTWEELYPNGTRIPGESGIGKLYQNINNTHTLDFHTETRSIGNYYLYVTLHKQNYEAKSALINLEILSREFSYTLQPGKIIDGIMEIENGDPLDLTITLQDSTRNISLEGATVETNYQNTNYTFIEEGNGIYSINITDYTRLDEDETSDTKKTAISISKANFTTQIIEVTIVLNNRRFNLTFSEEFRDNLVKVISGNRLSFDVTLVNSKDKSPIIDSTITLLIEGQTYEDLIIINNGDGSYTFSFLSYPEAFTATKTLSGEIIIQKTNYKTETIPITIEIKMTEIFPGMPTFYFIIIVVSIIGILGSVVAYRVIQQARIPKHVKKIRKVKGLIKSKKKITEIISVPSKAEMLAKLFGDDWREIDLSIEKSLGIEELKKQRLIKQAPIKDKIKEQRGEIE